MAKDVRGRSEVIIPDSIFQMFFSATMIPDLLPQKRGPGIDFTENRYLPEQSLFYDERTVARGQVISNRAPL